MTTLNTSRHKSVFPGKVWEIEYNNDWPHKSNHPIKSQRLVDSNESDFTKQIDSPTREGAQDGAGC